MQQMCYHEARLLHSKRGKFNVAKAATREAISHRLPLREDIANPFGANSIPMKTGDDAWRAIRFTADR